MANAKLTDDRLRWFLENGFNAQDIAGLLRSTIEEAEARIAALNKPDKKTLLATEREAERAERLRLAKAAARKRPMPPAALFEGEGSPPFLPAPDLRDWLFATFIDPCGELSSERHECLALANIGVLWTRVGNSRKQMRVLGQAEMPFPKGDQWAKARVIWQLEQCFGFLPDFVLTFDARYAQECDDWSWCALCKHELLHCDQALDDDGCPRFNEDTGRPCWRLRGHDVEQFIDVVHDFGAKAAGVEALVEAALNGPYFEEADIEGACGTCLK